MLTKFCINEVGRKKVYGIPDSSMTFSSCLCNRPIVVAGSASAPMTDNFTIYFTPPFFFTSFIKLVVDYISNHQGCKAEEVVEGVKKHLSRVPVYRTLEDLVKDGTVKDQATNRRDHKLYVDFNNLLVSVPKELEGFKKAYLNLLQESKERIRQKDFSKIARILGIDEPDPSKWNESEIHCFLHFEQKNHSNSLKEIHEFNEQGLIKIISNARQENALDIAKTLFFPAYDVSSFDFSALNYGAIGIFQTFANAYFYLSMSSSQEIV
jgi:hypothetical protein